MKRAFITIMFILSFFLCGTRVYADDKEPVPVIITSYDGETVAVKDGGVLFSSIPLTFTPSIDTGENYYCISTDDGASFGGYAKAEGPVTLYPDDDTAQNGRWQIRFKNVDADIEKESQLYKVSFDVTTPTIELVNEEDLKEYLRADTTLRFRLSDDQSKIARIVAKCADTVIDQVRFNEDDAKDEYEYSLDITGDVKADKGIVIECCDMAGNTGSISFSCGYDSSIPEVSASGIGNGKVVSDDCVIAIHATDRDSDVLVDYEITRLLGSCSYYTKVTCAPADTTVKFSDEGKYTVKISATDGAGNISRSISKDFTIDRTAPEINIGGVTEGVDIRRAARVSIDVFEEEPDDSVVNITLLRKSPAKSELIPLDSYSLKANRDIRSVDINDDGEYELTVCAEDGAGNRSSETRRFRVDATAPIVSVSGPDEGRTVSKIPTLRFGAGEMFYDSAVMTAVLEKMVGGAYTVVDTKRSVMRFETDHMDIEPPGEGRYRLSCTASDRSGNTSDKVTLFAVDSTPPVISGLDDVNGKYYREFSAPSKILSFIKDVSSVAASLYINDEKVPEGERIIKEGKYTLTIYAEDVAHNSSEKSAEFIVDHTSPQIVLSGFDKDGNIKKGSTVIVSLAESCDNLKSVMFNGKVIPVGSDNTARIPVDDYGQYSIDVVAEDPAGNVTDTSIHTSCYMYPAPVAKLLGRQEELVSDLAAGTAGTDKKGVLFGLLSTITGAAGIVYKVRSRG